MAKLGKKTTAVESNVVDFVQGKETTVVNEAPLTSEEIEVIQKSEELDKSEGANTKRLELATGVVSKHFNLGNDYKVNKFNDKGKVVNLTLENDDFIIAVTIKDSDRHGMVV